MGVRYPFEGLMTAFISPSAGYVRKRTDNTHSDIA